MARIPLPGEAPTSTGTPKVSPSAKGVSSGRKRASGGTTSGVTTPPSAVKQTKSDTMLTEDVAQMYTMVGVVVSMFHADVGSSIVENAEPTAIHWVQLGQRNPRVRKALVDMTTAGQWGNVVSDHIKMLAPALSPVMAGAFTGGIPMPAAQADTAPMSPEEAQLEFLRVADPRAYDMAMGMMNAQRDANGHGGPTDTVASPPSAPRWKAS